MVLSPLVIQASSRDSMVFWGAKRQEHLDDVFSNLCKQMGGLTSLGQTVETRGDLLLQTLLRTNFTGVSGANPERN